MNGIIKSDWFEKKVIKNWSEAVAEAVLRFNEVRPLVIAGLNSTDNNIRAAAIATLNEANDKSAHDIVAACLADDDFHVREEALEYIQQFPINEDATALFKLLTKRQHLFLASFALQSLFNQGRVVDEDDSDAEIDDGIAEWERLLKANGFLA